MKLANLQQIASVIGIIGLIVFIISIQQEKDQLVLNQAGVSNVSTNFQQTAITSIWIRVISFTLLVAILFIKHKERDIKIQEGLDTTSATPELNITVGLWIMLLAIIIISIGLQEKQQQAVAKSPIILS
jgi:uncharacterized membrane protein YidH (DUF202 family)